MQEIEVINTEHKGFLEIDKDQINICVNGRTINNLRFADDISLLTQLLRHAQVLLDRVDKVSSKYGQEISDSKTEWMLLSTKSEQTVNNRIKEGLLFWRKELQNVEIFKYVGTTLMANCDCSTDIRIRTALKVLSNLNNICKNKNIKNETKMRLYISLILPIALYGCVAWTRRSAEDVVSGQVRFLFQIQ